VSASPQGREGHEATGTLVALAPRIDGVTLLGEDGIVLEGRGVG